MMIFLQEVCDDRPALRDSMIAVRIARLGHVVLEAYRPFRQNHHRQHRLAES
jgi:hypothetical protein